MGIERTVHDPALATKNRQTLWNMQIWYLDNYESLVDLGYSPKESMWTYICQFHPKELNGEKE